MAAASDPVRVSALRVRPHGGAPLGSRRRIRCAAHFECVDGLSSPLEMFPRLAAVVPAMSGCERSRSDPIASRTELLMVTADTGDLAHELYSMVVSVIPSVSEGLCCVGVANRCRAPPTHRRSLADARHLVWRRLPVVENGIGGDARSDRRGLSCCCLPVTGFRPWLLGSSGCLSEADASHSPQRGFDFVRPVRSPFLRQHFAATLRPARCVPIIACRPSGASLSSLDALAWYYVLFTTPGSTRRLGTSRRTAMPDGASISVRAPSWP